jgi:hypothetical protein
MTSQGSEKSRSVYLAVRTRCRLAGLAMASADPVIRAFHAMELYDLHAIATALKQQPAAASATKPAESKESKGDTKSGSAESRDVAALVDKVRAVLVASRRHV